MAKISINLKDGSVEKESSPEIIVGIDLGTTNSLVAYMDQGKPRAVRGADRRHTLVPSIVHFAEDGSILVGDAARQKLVSDPLHTIYSVKRLMGKSYRDLQQESGHLGYQVIDEDPDKLVRIRVRDRYYTPIELSAEILRELRLRIEAELGQPVQKAVITVPAYFNDTQRQATRDAGKLAGLEVLRIINEPTAASLAYGLDRLEESGHAIAVYDLGGGTFDLSILQLEGGIFEVLATHGDTHLGGDDLDRLILQHWQKELSIADALLQEDKSLQQQLRIAAEKAKKQLSEESHFTEKAGPYELSLSREAFESLAAPLVETTLQHCKKALKDAGLQARDIRHVVMVGGSTRIPYIRSRVSEFFGQPVHTGVNPDEVVALGAAIQADILAGNQQGLLLIDVTPLSLGIETVGGLMDVIIPRNAKVPSRVGREYTTSIDGQANLKVAVYQGERDLVEHNRKLGEFILRGIPPMPAGLPKIEIQFLIDADGILTVKALEKRSGTQQTVEIRSQYGISEEEMALMLMDSIRHAQEDAATRGLLEARNEGQSVLLASRKFLKQHSAILDPEEIQRIGDLASVLEKSIGGEDKDVIHRAMDSLNTYSAPIAHRVMDVVIKESMSGQKIIPG